MQNTRTKTLCKYVFPAILTNVCIFLFTIIDGIFVGQGVGQDALGAVNIAMPFVMIATALNMLTSIGGVTVTAIRLGRNDKQGANQAFMHSLTANVVIAVIITLLGTVVATPLCRMLGADEMYLPLVKDYVFWWALFAIPSALSVNFQSFCRNDGSPMLVAAATVASTVLNIFLDWLLVFPLQMGVIGAALATGISQTVSMLIVLMHFILRKGELRISRYKPEAKLFRKVIFRGLPEMIAQFATPVTTICLNHVLVTLQTMGGCILSQTPPILIPVTVQAARYHSMISCIVPLMSMLAYRGLYHLILIWTVIAPAVYMHVPLQ